jgi:hypothetical protein
VTDTSISTQNNITTRRITYQSNQVQEDLIAYTQYLRNDGGFVLTRDMDLLDVPSIVELGKQSVERGNIVIMTIEYDDSGYTVIIQKGVGEFFDEQ